MRSIPWQQETAWQAAIWKCGGNLAGPAGNMRAAKLPHLLAGR